MTAPPKEPKQAVLKIEVGTLEAKKANRWNNAGIGRIKETEPLGEKLP